MVIVTTQRGTPKMRGIARTRGQRGVGGQGEARGGPVALRAPFAGHLLDAAGPCPTLRSHHRQSSPSAPLIPTRWPPVAQVVAPHVRRVKCLPCPLTGRRLCTRGWGAGGGLLCPRWMAPRDSMERQWRCASGRLFQMSTERVHRARHSMRSCAILSPAQWLFARLSREALHCVTTTPEGCPRCLHQNRCVTPRCIWTSTERPPVSDCYRPTGVG